MNHYAIQTEGLSKQFGERHAVRDLTLQVPHGEVFAFLGPNGAGKSTSVKMLLGLVEPSGGTASVLGHSPGAPQALARIGFLPEHFRFHPWLQATELLELHGRLYDMPRATCQQRIPEVLELVGLTEHARRPISGFSKGMLQRIGLAQALLNQPALVFLDEPTSALDPFGRILVRNIIRQLKQAGTTIFLNSHLLGEVEATADRAAFIREGQVLRSMSLNALQQAQIELHLIVGTAPDAMVQALQAMISEPIQRVTQEASGHIVLTLLVPEDALLPQIAACVHHYGADLYSFTPRRASLEEIFLDVIGTQDSGQ